MLNEALNKAGVTTELEHWDGHKHIDIYVPLGKLYIEIDGMPHYTSVKQITADFLRDHFSDLEGYNTFRIPSHIVEDECDALVRAIQQIVQSAVLK